MIRARVGAGGIPHARSQPNMNRLRNTYCGYIQHLLSQSPLSLSHNLYIFSLSLPPPPLSLACCLPG